VVAISIIVKHFHPMELTFILFISVSW